MFDAGAIMAHLDVETSGFDRKLTAAEERVKAFERGRHEVRISAVFDNASLGQARRIFTQLDQQLSREAMQRLRSSPQGSVLGALNALFSPHPVTGGPSPQQSATQGLLGRMVRAQGGGLPGTGISSVLVGQAAGSAGTTRIKLDSSTINDIGNAVSGALPDTPSGGTQDTGSARQSYYMRRTAEAAERAAVESRESARESAQAARDSSDASHSFLRGFLGATVGRLAGRFRGGDGGGGMRGFSTITAHAGPFTAGLAGGIGPGILGISAIRATQAAGIGTGLAALPALAAGVGAFGLLGAGAGIIGAGIKQLIGSKNTKQDPNAQGPLYEQAQKIADTFKSSMRQAAGGMLEPLKQAFSQIPGLLRGITPLLRQVFAGAGTFIEPLLQGINDLAHMILPAFAQALRSVAPLIRPLLDGLGGLVRGILPGLTVLMRAAAPAIHALAGGLGEIGRGLGTMLAQFAPVIRQSSTILGALLDVISALFPIVGQLAGVFARALAPVFVQLAGIIRSLLPVLTIIGRLFADLSAAILGDLVSAFGALSELFHAIQPALSAFARALSGVFTLLENSGVFAILGDALEALVKPLATMINQLLRGLTPILPPLIRFFSQLSAILITGLSQAIVALLPPLTDLAMVVLQAIAQMLPIVLPLFISLTKIITAAFVRVVTDLAVAMDFLIRHIPPRALRDIALGFLAIWAAIKVGGLIATVSNPVTLIGTAVALLILGIVELATHWHQVWTNIKNWANDAWHFLRGVFRQGIVQDILAVWSLGLIPLATHWNGTWHNIQHWTDNVRIWLHQVFGTDIGGFFTRTIPGWLNTLYGWAQRYLGDIRGAFRNTASWFHQVFGTDVANFFTRTIPNVFHTAVDAIGRAWNRIKDTVAGPVRWVAQHIIEPLFNGIDAVTHFVGLGRPLQGAVNFLQGMATGGKITRGTHETADDVLIRVSKNETVLSAYHSRLLAPLLARVGVPGYAVGGLVNPIGRGLVPERVDMGVDYGGSGPLYAIGSGRIVNLWNHGWPGGGFIGLQLNPPYGSGYWYYAEDVMPLLNRGIHVGAGVTAGQYIADAIGGPSGIEVGWAAAPGTGTTAAHRDGQDRAGLAHGDPGYYPTAWGMAANTLIGNLGGPKGLVRGQVQGGTPGFGDIFRTLGQIFSGLGRFARAAIDIAKGDIGGALGAFMHFLPHGAGGARGLFAQLLTKIPGTLASDVIKHIVSAVKGFVAGQQGGVPNVAATGPLQVFARKLVDAMWGDGQWPYFADIVRRESNWNVFATNPGSGAYGIPQALPGSKMASAGADWRTSGYTQLRWMVGYIKNRWHTPAEADANEQQNHWYREGGVIREPVIGFGLRSGGRYHFAETEPEIVTPMSRSRGGPAIGTVVIQLPEGGTVARALTDLNFWLSVSRQQGWAGGMPGG
jgi:phage-related protein